MQIDRSNHEIWLIDWLDGKLNEVQIQELQLFLKQNPDLNEEFEDLGFFRLNPPKNEFQFKKQLIKTPAGLTESQFDYLCAAFLENDLSPQQQTELKEAILSDPAKKKSFDLIVKMKLVPPAVSYNGKSNLIKRTLAGKIIRLSVIGLSAAAVVVIGLLISVPKPSEFTGYEKSAGIVKSDTSTVNEPARETSTGSEENKPASLRQASKPVFVASASTSSDVNKSDIKEQTSKNNPEEKPVKTINTARISRKINLKGEVVPNTLVAMSTDMTASSDDGRSKFSKIIAKTFREKILKEKAPRDKPLKAYEIAEASVSGLNKIFGWEMALDERSSDDGKTEKIYFSSRILKFNTPAKKTEP